MANNGDVAASGTLTATGGNGVLTTTLVVKIDGVEYNASQTGTSWSLDAGQSVVYEEGKSYGITADAETTDADGDKATDSASAGDLTPSADLIIDSFEVANNGDAAASGTLTATGGNGALTTTLVVKIDGGIHRPSDRHQLEPGCGSERPTKRQPRHHCRCRDHRCGW
ncbi:MAG: hypothetical protein R3E57_03715 [Porticoccaceae bacterium]